jgi:flagellin-like protein
MKKAISPMVATVLLIGFTIAVGALLSVWFTTFTRTQTTSITGSAACHAGNVKIFSNVTTTGSSAVRVYVTNLRGDMSITVTGIMVSCGTSSSSSATSLPLTINAGQTGYSDVSGLSGCTSSNTRIDITGNCSTGGSFLASCPTGGCGVY